MLFMKKICYYLSLALITSFLKPIVSAAQTATQYPQQYGQPFNGVPDRQDVTMYQVNTRAFSKEGNFKGVTARLDSIKALGVNVVYMMPIFPVGTLKGTNSPYATKDYNAVGSEFGTLDDLRALVEGAHKRNMALLLDWVGNHTAWDNVWIGNKGWYVTDSTGNIKYPQTWKDVAQLNFKNDDMRLAMISAMKSWVLEANVDGFRCDYADGPPVDFWKQALDTLKAIPGHKLLFLAEGTRSGNFSAGFDYNFGFRFYENLKRIYGQNRSVKSIDTITVEEYKGTEDGQGMVRYITNHDVNSSDGTPLDLFGGEKGSMAAFVVVAYMKGTPMVYNGQETATPYRIVFPFKNSPISWSPNPGVTAEYKKIIALRNGDIVIRRGALTSFSSDDVCVFTKQHESKKVLVISNLRNKQVTYSLSADFANSSWKDAFTGSEVKLSSQIMLQPYQYLVLKN
jgi:glycosidase